MAELDLEVPISKEIAGIFKAMGIKLPPNIKEISTPVERSAETKKIILPEGMAKDVASKELMAQWQNEEQLTDMIKFFDKWNPQDVLVAIKRVTEKAFGWMNAQTSVLEGAPKEIDIPVDIKDGKTTTEKAFFGEFIITGWDKAAAKVDITPGGIVMQVKAKRKYSEVVTNYFNLIVEHLNTSSIYRGKNIVITKHGFDLIENKGSDKIVLNRDTRLTVDTFVKGSLGEKGKRCFLFTGTYGNGKTEIAMEVGKQAVEEHGMSFFYLKDTSIFDMALGQAKQYAPCILFVEDLDEIGGGEERDARINTILNKLDGVESKGNDITVLFTTNHPGRINPALRRPGRIDLIVKFENPDRHSKKEILKLYLHGIDGEDKVDYNALVDLIPDVSGAVVAEVAKRAVKLAAKEGWTNTDSVEACIASMKYQIELMEGGVEKRSRNDQFVDSFTDVMLDSIWNHPNGQLLLHSNGIIPIK